MNQFGHPLGGIDVLAALGGPAAALAALGAYPVAGNPLGFQSATQIASLIAGGGLLNLSASYSLNLGAAAISNYRNDAENGGYGAKGTNLQTTAKRLDVVQGTITATKNTFGQRNDASVATFLANIPQGAGAEVMGYTPGLAAAFYPDIDSVCTYVANAGRPPLFTVTGATFAVVIGGTARIVMPAGTPLTALQMAQLFQGLQVLTNHVTPWTAWVDSWDPAGTWVQVLGGFTHLGGSSAANQDPTGSPVAGGGAVQVAFAPLTKIWGQNTNITLNSAAFSPQKGAGYELGVFNNTGVDHTRAGENIAGGGYSWGYDAVSLGANRVGSAFIARGHCDVGFQARAGVTAGFLVDGPYHYDPGSPGFISTQTSGVAFAVAPGSSAAPYTFSVSSAGVVAAQSMFVAGAISAFGTGSGLELGSTTAAGTPFIDLHSSGAARDYDVRLIASGGSTNADGQGVLDVVAAQVHIDAALLSQALASSPSYANDAAASAGGVVVSQFYRNGSAVMIRVA